MVSILIAVLILILALWFIYYLPLPPNTPPFVKPALVCVLLIIAIFYLLSRHPL